MNSINETQRIPCALSNKNVDFWFHPLRPSVILFEILLFINIFSIHFGFGYFYSTLATTQTKAIRKYSYYYKYDHGKNKKVTCINN